MKLPSPWVYAASSVALSNLSAPTGLSITGITGASATASWATGSTTADVEVLLGSPSGSALTRIVKLAAGSNNYKLLGLDTYVSTSFTCGVRHVEGFNVSLTITASFDTAGQAIPQLPDINYVLVYIG